MSHAIQSGRRPTLLMTLQLWVASCWFYFIFIIITLITNHTSEGNFRIQSKLSLMFFLAMIGVFNVMKFVSVIEWILCSWVRRGSKIENKLVVTSPSSIYIVWNRFQVVCIVGNLYYALFQVTNWFVSWNLFIMTA